MPVLVYVHGFLSSPQSHKATLTSHWLKEHAPAVDYVCPFLSPYPEETQTQLTGLMEDLAGSDSVGFVGSSLGGFWSTWLVEHFGHRAVLVNPSVRPYELLHTVAGIPQHNFYTDDVYHMTEAHGQQFRDAYCQTFQDRERYWLLAQTGDETLDYRQAVERYQGCRQTIEDGGDHSFQGFERYLPEILEFLFPDSVGVHNFDLK